ncbi:MAG: hypothetical protein ACR2H1_11415 [Limisphaerales bacterium]
MKRGSPKPTHDEVKDVLDFILENGEAPRGWDFDAIDWRHPKSENSGGIPDMQSFRHLLEAMRDALRIEIVRK